IESLISMGLTDKPNIAKMPELLNQILKEERMKELLEKLKTELSIPPETEDSAVLEYAIEAFQAMSNDLKKLKEALGIDPEASIEDATLVAPEVAVNSFTPTAEEWNAMKEEIAALKQKDVANKVHNAVANGKILPVQREWAMNYAAGDPQGFDRFLANSRSVVSFGEVVGKNFSGQTEKAPLDPEQEKVNALLGIDRELFDKYNKS
ncbi:MAG: phage protease, partial [Nitrospinota bacterium]